MKPVTYDASPLSTVSLTYYNEHERTSVDTILAQSIMSAFGQ